MAEEIGLKVDQDAFKKLMNEQKSRAKADAKAKKTGHTDLTIYRSAIDVAGATQFLGYDNYYAEAKLTFLLSKGAPVSHAKIGDDVEIILDLSLLRRRGWTGCRLGKDCYLNWHSSRN